MRRFLITFLFIFSFYCLTSFKIEARSGCCSHHNGVCGCGCCDGTPLSSTCAPYYPECNGGGEEPTQTSQPIYIPLTSTPYIPLPTNTPILIPTNTPIPLPTNTPASSNTPIPTEGTSPTPTSAVLGETTTQESSAGGTIASLALIGGALYGINRYRKKKV